MNFMLIKQHEIQFSNILGKLRQEGVISISGASVATQELC